jgi:hypothetical protein
MKEREEREKREERDKGRYESKESGRKRGK